MLRDVYNYKIIIAQNSDIVIVYIHYLALYNMHTYYKYRAVVLDTAQTWEKYIHATNIYTPSGGETKIMLNHSQQNKIHAAKIGAFILLLS